MSVLTKIFVVLVTFLSVLLVALVVPFVAKTEDFRKQYENQRTLTLKANAAARTLQSRINSLDEARGERRATWTATERKLKAEITTSENDLAEAATEVNQLKSELAQREVNMGRLTAAAEQAALLLTSQSEEVEEYRTRFAAAEKRAVELDDRINDLNSQLDSFSRQVQRLKEESYERTAELAKMQKLWDQVPKATRLAVAGTGSVEEGGTEPYVPREAIHGRITKVQQFGDDKYVELDIGSVDGVAMNMKFWVHRGGQFVGTVVIMTVDANAAAGRLQITAEGVGEIVAGDTVLTGDEQES